MEKAMKITQLLEYPAAIGGPLAAAKAREAGKPLSDFGTVGAKRAAGQGKMPAVTAPSANLKVVPGGKSVAPAATGTAAPAVKYNVPTASTPPVQAATPKTAAPAPAAQPAQAKQPGADVFTQTGIARPTGATAQADLAKLKAASAPTQPATTQPQSATKPAAPGPTGDATLNKPLPAKDPNAPGLATKIGRGIGQVGKAVGAVAGVPAGIARAVQKGYQASASTIGGPGPGGSAAGGGGFARGAPAAPAGGAAAGSDEVADLKARIQAIDQRLNKAGI